MTRGESIDLPWGVGDGPVLHIDPLELSDIIEARGIGCELRRGVLCPCARLESRQPRSGCKACRGIGYSYPADRREPIVAVITSREARSRDLAAGRHYTGTATVLLPLGVIPARGDMLRPDDEVHTVQQVVFRQVQQADPRVLTDRRTAPDQLAPADGPRREYLLYPDAGAIESVHFIHPDTEELVAAFPGLDYDRPAPDRLEWRPGRGPRSGRGYTVRFLAPAAYLVGDAQPAYRAEGGGGPYPYRAQVVRYDRWGDPELNTDGRS